MLSVPQPVGTIPLVGSTLIRHLTTVLRLMYNRVIVHRGLNDEVNMRSTIIIAAVTAAVLLGACAQILPEPRKDWLIYDEEHRIYDRETLVFLGYEKGYGPEAYGGGSSVNTGPYYGYDWCLTCRGFIGADHLYHSFDRSHRGGKY